MSRSYTEITRDEEYQITAAIGRRLQHPHRLTVYVEGKSDESFFRKFEGDAFYVQAMDGKEKTLKRISGCEQLHQRKSCRQFAVALVDLDDDGLYDLVDLSHNWILYIDAYDDAGPSRDLETMLIRSKVLDRVLFEYGIDQDKCRTLRLKLGNACALMGAAYAAKSKLEMNLQTRVGSFDHVNFKNFVDIKNLTVYTNDCFEEYFKHVQDEELRTTLRGHFDSVYSSYVEKPWYLARGHDLVRLLSSHLSHIKKRLINVAELEKMLRVGHFPEFVTSEVYKRLETLAHE